jgi:hypothetical protein
MKKVYIQTVTGKANVKDIKSIQKFAPELEFTYDSQFHSGWSVDIDTVENAELLAMRLRTAGLTKPYYMGIYESDGRTKINAINLF